MQIINEQNVAQFLKKHKVQTRPNAGPGLWLTLLLPLALIISAATQPIISTSTYKLSSIFSVGLICSSLVFLYQISSNKRLKIFNAWLIAACIIVTVLFRICLHRGMAFSIWSAIFSTILYYKLYIFVLEKLPKCFTLGEAAVCTQSYTLLLYFTLVNVFQHVEKTPTTVMQMSTLTIQVGLFGISTIIFLTYLCGIRSPTKFYILTGSVFVFTVLLPLEILLKKNALLWILNLFWDDLQTVRHVITSI
jgi:dolichol kinase